MIPERAKVDNRRPLARFTRFFSFHIPISAYEVNRFGITGLHVVEGYVDLEA